MSRPVRSVPSQCSIDGPWLRARRSIWLGSYCVTIGANTAIRVITRKTISPVMASRCRMKRRITSRVGLRTTSFGPSLSGTSPASEGEPKSSDSFGSNAWSIKANSRIDERIDHIGDQVCNERDDCQHERDADDNGIIARFHPAQQQAADAWPAEDRFDEDRA